MLGQTMEEGTIIKWFKNEGDSVEKGEPLLEVMTDKVNMEVESPDSGILRKIIAHSDETVPIMAMIAILGTADEPIDDMLQDIASSRGTTLEIQQSVISSLPELPEAEAPAQVADRLFISPRARRLSHELNIPLEALAGKGTGPGGRIVEKDVKAFASEFAGVQKVKATPLAARIAADRGVEIRGIAGSGPGGRVTREDVLQAAVAPSFPVLQGKVIPFAGMRKTVADNVARSAQTSPHVTLTAEVDMTEAVRIRKQVLNEFERKYSTKLTFTDLIVKAAARAILDHPIVNSSLQGNEIHISGEVNIGLAVALDGGLIVPVLRNVDKKSLPEISSESKSLIEKARAGRLGGNEIAGGTFSLTNLGAFGIDVFNPIITPGQSAILGVCRIAEKPVVIAGEVVVRSMMNLCLSFDHRVMDGAPAAQFLSRVRELLESPYQLLI